jgi:uncharacterized protein YciI
MYIVLLKFSRNKDQASTLMEAHNQWIKQGFEDGIFVLTGNLQPGLGGAIMAHGESRQQIECRVNADPFVCADVVAAEILEIDPRKTEERLDFLLN